MQKTLPALGILLLACGSTSPSTPPAEKPSSQMPGHFVDTIELRNGLTRGDLKGLQSAARLLAEAPDVSVDAQWRPHLDRMRAAAKRAAAAPHLATAGTAVGEVLAACGACHSAAGARLPVEAPPWPPMAEDLAEHMQQHHWAARRMWEGLTVPSPEAWRTGLDLLSGAEYPAEGLLAAGSKVNIGALVHEAARRGRDAEPKDWPKVYGEVMSTCGMCHAQR